MCGLKQPAHFARGNYLLARQGIGGATGRGSAGRRRGCQEPILTQEKPFMFALWHPLSAHTIHRFGDLVQSAPAFRVGPWPSRLAITHL